MLGSEGLSSIKTPQICIGWWSKNYGFCGESYAPILTFLIKRELKVKPAVVCKSMHFNQGVYNNLNIVYFRWYRSWVTRTSPARCELRWLASDFSPAPELCPHLSGCHLVIIAPQGIPRGRTVLIGLQATLPCNPSPQGALFKKTNKHWQSLFVEN